MYRRQCFEQLKMDLPFGVELDKNNRWVVLASMFPWKLIDEIYQKYFPSNEGQVAKSSRLAFGSLYIQIEEKFTDEQTRRHIQENPYLQYFCGFDHYTMESPFDQSMMTIFRKRFTSEMIQEITSLVFKEDALGGTDNPDKAVDSPEDEPLENQNGDMQTQEEAIINSDSNTQEVYEHRGTLILDGTCCPADIHYPTDIGLLRQSREIMEKVIDVLYEANREKFKKKPRTYRENARDEYLAYSKKRSHTAKETRKCVHRSLLFLRRDIGHVDMMIDKMGITFESLPEDLYRKYLIAQEVYRQQNQMYNEKSHKIDDRIVSIAQPHVRPIIRGKAGTPVEFGAKIVLGLVGGYAFVLQEGWDNFSETKALIGAAEKYKTMFGCYPKTIIGDRAYQSRENRNWCNTHGIRLSGPRTGRKSFEQKKEEAKQIYQDSCERVQIEGEFGIVKRRYGLDRLMTRLPNTSMTCISMGFFVSNMERKLRIFFAPYLDWALDYDFDTGFLFLFSRVG